MIARSLQVFAPLAALLLLIQAALADITPFVGTFEGSAEVISVDGSAQARDMSVTIAETKKGFSVAWTSTTLKDDGRNKAKSYEINFVPSTRDDVFSAAMEKNIFGHEVQLDPMKGEPYVWARLSGDTLSVYSLFVDDSGGYEIQQFDRTLTEGGLRLDYRSVRNGAPQRMVTTLLERQ